MTVIFQSDLSAAFVLVAIFLSMWWVAVGRPFDLAIFIAATSGSVLLALNSVPELQDRFAAWTDPWSNPQFGETINRSTFALAGGGLTGTGPGEGSADWVIGATNQFAFVPIAEELGFIGGSAVLSSFLLLTGVTLRLATIARREFEGLLAVGIAIFFASQAWAPIAVALRLLPPNDISLPFVAANGAALFTCSVALAVLLKISETISYAADPTEIIPRLASEPKSTP
jgi:cell division protein FtsW (lipid II flippase)